MLGSITCRTASIPATSFTRYFTRQDLLTRLALTLPSLFQEVQGIAQASNQLVETIFAWQLIDECWWYLDELTAKGAEDERGHSHQACSAMTCNDGISGITAQTQDLYRHFDGTQVLLRYFDPDGLEILAPSSAGMLAYNGVNSAGLAVCITTVSQLAHQSHGVGSGLMVAALLRCRSIDEALWWLRSVPIASGNSWTLGTRNRSVVAEVSATDVAVVSDGRRGVHTNHPLVLAPVRSPEPFQDSVDRLHQLDTAVHSGATVNDMVNMYSSKPICRSRSGSDPAISVATMIFELSNTLHCHLAPGPLDSDKLVTYTLSTNSDQNN